jgi:hypothetical protein
MVPSEKHSLPRKPRTPSSLGYQPLPLRIGVPPISLSLPGLGQRAATLDVTLFDFGAISAAARLPFEADAATLTAVAGSLAEPTTVVAAIESALQPLFQKLQPCIRKQHWSGLTEEFFVFQLFPERVPAPDVLMERRQAWLAGLVRLEGDPLSAAEVAEALRLRLSYGQQDLLVADWAAALIVDVECEELLDAIAFANLQLLELRHIDSRLETRLEDVYRQMGKFARWPFPFWRTHTRPLRALGELKVEANVMLERSAKALKLVGDPYLARAYQLIAARFHLDEWGQNIRRSISLLEGIYQVVFDQASVYRAELLEATIVLLIVFEIVMAFAQ